MTEAQIQGYIAIASILVQGGTAVVGKVKDLIKLFHPQAALTEEQINAIEQAAMADAEKRKNERIAMGQPSES